MTTLSDTDIRTKIDAGSLVRGGSAAQIGPACYELRMGSIYYDLTEGDKRIDASTHGTVIIKPGHRVVLITLEELVVPEDVIARVTSKGSLFSVGLSPVSTYADPGFTGNIGVVTQNMSDKYIVLPIGESIAKVDFSKLSSVSAKPYSGQHGFQTQIWPIKHHLQKNYEDVKGDPRIDTEENESFKIIPRTTVDFLKKIRSRQRVVDWSILAAVLVNAMILVLASTKYLDTTVSIATNLVSTALVAVIMLFKK